MAVDFRYLHTTAALHSAVQEMEGAERFYIDTEFNTYSGKRTLCLIQVSAGATAYVIDTLELQALEPLVTLLARPGAEWVLHDGRCDLELLLAAFRLAARPRVFDTRVAWGLLSPEPTVSLAYLLYRLLGERAAKEHQADRWHLRPLSEEQIAYAASDVMHLPALYAELERRLAAQGKQALVPILTEEQFDPAALLVEQRAVIGMADFRNAWELDYDGQAALQFLIDWYNGAAPAERPASLRWQTLFLIARRMPESGEELTRINGVPARWARRVGDHLMGQMIRATYEARAADYPRLTPSPYVTYLEIRTEGWLQAARAFLAESLAMAPEFALPPWLLQRMRNRILDAKHPAAAEREFTGWRQQWLAPVYAEFCRLVPFGIPVRFGGDER